VALGCRGCKDGGGAAALAPMLFTLLDQDRRLLAF
jgi:hypothetical protein